MNSLNHIDFYIGYPGHPRFRTPELIEDDLIRVIVQKYEMIVFTNKGELLMDPNFGADLPILLHQTKLSAQEIEKDIKNQINTYIDELRNVPYTLSVQFFDDPDRYQEYMVIYFSLRDYEVYAAVS